MAVAKKTVKSVKKVPVSKAKPTDNKVPAKTDKVAKAVKETIKEINKDSTAIEQTDSKESKPIVAKAGRRSTKAIKEADEKAEKEARKAEVKDDTVVQKPKKVQKQTRSRLERRSKKYRDVAKLVNNTKLYSVTEAMELATKTSPVKFDASVELHFNLGVDPRQADQNVRGTVVLPAGSGKSTRIAVFGEPDEVASAKKAGADIAGGDEFLQQLDKEKIDFDILIASPKVMARLSKYARLLGPKGLMPNPKSGTVTADVAKAVSEAKAGRVEYRVDSSGIIHVAVGKISFGATKLEENANAVIASIKAAKPASLKGLYVKSSFVTTTMGPSIKLTF